MFGRVSSPLGARVRISFFPSEQDRMPRAVECTWEMLAIQLAAPVLSPCTIAVCLGSKCEHKLGQAWSPAVYPPGVARGKRNVGSVSLLVVDLDHMTELMLAQVAIALQPYRYIVHATHSDREGDRCMRAVIDLDAPVPATEWDRFVPAAIAHMRLPLADRKANTGGADGVTFDASRLYFLPSRPHDGGYLVDTNEGAALDTAAILAAAPPRAVREHVAAPGSAAVCSPETMHAVSLQLAAAWPPRGRHYAFLALAGALATHGWPEDAITELTTRVAQLMPNSDDKAIDDRPAQAASSIALVQAGQPVTGWGTLANEYLNPAVVDAVRAALGMVDNSDMVRDIFGEVAETPATSSSEYPSLAALDAFASLVQQPAVPEVTAEPGTFLAFYQQARLDIAGRFGAADKAAPRVPSPLFIPARDLFTMDFPATPWLVQYLIPRGGTAAILAEAKSTKSWGAIEIAYSVSCGLDVFGKYRVPSAVPVAYFFAEEMGPSIRNRLRAFAAWRGMKPEDMTRNLHVQPRGESLDLTRDEDVARIVAACRAIGNIGLLVLDPLRDLHTGAENESDDMADVLKRVKAIGTLLGCTVLLVHHAKRASKDRQQDDNRPGSDARGSSVIEGALDAIISLRDLRGNGENVFTNDVITQVKNAKGAGKFALTLSIKDDTEGTSIHAAWSIGDEAIATADGQTFDELVLACLEHLLMCEIKKERPQTNELIRKAVSRKNDIVTAAMIGAEKDGFVLKNLVGKKHLGWLITERGRELVRAAAIAQTADNMPCPPPAEPTPSLSHVPGSYLISE